MLLVCGEGQCSLGRIAFGSGLERCQKTKRGVRLDYLAKILFLNRLRLLKAFDVPLLLLQKCLTVLQQLRADRRFVCIFQRSFPDR